MQFYTLAAVFEVILFTWFM